MHLFIFFCFFCAQNVSGTGHVRVVKNKGKSFFFTIITINSEETQKFACVLDKNYQFVRMLLLL